MKTSQPRQQPAQCEGDGGMDVQQALFAGVRQPMGGGLDLFEGIADDLQIMIGFRRELHFAVVAVKQREADKRLEGTDLAAHGAWSYVQFFGCFGKALIAPGGLERPQGIQRWQTCRHVVLSPVEILSLENTRAVRK